VLLVSTSTSPANCAALGSPSRGYISSEHGGSDTTNVKPVEPTKVQAAPFASGEIERVQRRTVAALSFAQAMGGIAVAGAVAAGALLAAGLGGDAAAGLTQTAGVLGAALFSLPLARLALSRGRRIALSTGLLLGAIGAATVVFGGVTRSLLFVLVGSLLLGVAQAAGYQGRYAATDLATEERRGRSLAVVVWAATLGAVVGPNMLEFSGSIAMRFGLPQLTGPFVLATVVLLLAAVVLQVFLRPDPYLLGRKLAANLAQESARSSAPAARSSAAQSSAPAAQSSAPAARSSAAQSSAPAAQSSAAQSSAPAAQSSAPAESKPRLRDAIGHLRDHPRAMLGVGSVSIGHVAMVMVMVMTPVHMAHVDVSLRLIGFVISVHVLGMFAFSPAVGWSVDRFGRVPNIVAGSIILVLSCVVSALAPPDSVVVLGAGLFLLGLGWSFTLIAGSTLLTDDSQAADRPAIQGFSDLTMNVAGAVGGAAAGIIMLGFSYAVLCSVAAIPVLGLLWWAFRQRSTPA